MKSKTKTRVTPSELQAMYGEIQEAVNLMAAQHYGEKATLMATKHLNGMAVTGPADWSGRYSYLEARKKKSRSWMIAFRMFCALVEAIKAAKLDELIVSDSEQET